MLGQEQEGLAASGVYARESWNREWRKDSADEQGKRIHGEFP